MAKKVKKYYDYIYLTNTPSFYKLNLCNRLGERGLKGLLVFYGYGGEAVNGELGNPDKWNFDYKFLHAGDSHKRNFIATFKALCRLIKGIECKKVLFSGWLANEYNLFSFFSPRRKNVVVVESTIYESSVTGLKGWLKKRIVRRMGAALPSGRRHTELLKALGFKGTLKETGSVGIFHKPEKSMNVRQAKMPFNYLYVGRLIDCKNLEFLIAQFNKSKRNLTIVGTGELEEKLKAAAGSNIKFSGFIENEQLNDVYQKHDIFVLPSYSETWGMVVEEAIYFGLPVMVSDRVGSGPEMVESLGTGLAFHYNDPDDFERKCLEIEQKYVKFATASVSVNFDEREQKQIEAYLETING